ncbi:helix-turn-helix domain-containing protein [Asticcacaulis sp. AC402]|uniref:helix-turn-helix domain-containing protein n=1 Tax=Asticcacaulis sp. AC402 TaxID=1282361 RepID=UPI00138AED29|nr:helix-turn-helix domain-containing protein [Asticcacaulis sp. AC402]
MQFGLWEALSGAAGMGISLSGLACLVAATSIPHENNALIASRRWLILLILLLGFHLLCATLDALGVFERHPVLVGLESVHWPFLPIALQGYVQALTRASLAEPPGRPLWRRFWLAGLAVVCLIPLLTLSPNLRHDLGADNSAAMNPSLHLMLAIIGILVFWMIWMGLLAAAGWRMWCDLRRHDRWLRSEYSNIEGLDLSWTRWLLAVGLVPVAVTLIDQCLTVADLPSLPDAVFSMLAGFLSLAFCALHVRHDRWAQSRAIYHAKTGPDAALADAPNAEPDTGPDTGLDTVSDAGTARYARSAMTEADCERVLAKLDAAMRSNALWRNPFLSLADLAAASATRHHQISQALNTRRGTNFYDYVNALRIEEACLHLRSGTATVLEISETVGFNAKSTFNEAFRRHTGQTPTKYRAAAASHAATDEVATDTSVATGKDVALAPSDKV